MDRYILVHPRYTLGEPAGRAHAGHNIWVTQEISQGNPDGEHVQSEALVAKSTGGEPPVPINPLEPESGGTGMDQDVPG